MKLIVHIFFISFVFSQTSSLSMNGLGEYVNTMDASSVALGDSKYFVGYDNRISFSSPSSYWKSSLSNLMMSISTNINDFSSNQLVENNFNLFSFTFPISKQSVCAFGMNPLVRSEFDVSEQNFTTLGADNSPEGGAIAFKTDYSFSGGISEFFILYSSKVTNSFSLGFRWSKLFGASKNKYYLNIYDLSFPPNANQDPAPSYSNPRIESFIDNNRYSSNKYVLEFRFEHNKVNAVFSYGESKLLNIEHTPFYCGSLSDSDCENYYNIYSNLAVTEHHVSTNKLLENGFGLKYKLNKRFSLILEHHQLDTFNTYDFINIFKNNNPSIRSDHIGFYYKFDNDINSIVNQSIVKFGMFNKINKFNNVNIYDRGLTLGFGINYFENKNFIDFSFKIGIKSTEYNDFDDEKYYSIMLSLLGGEKWFINERNK